MTLTERLNATLNEYIRPATFPVAIKVSKDENLPSGVRRPQKLFGHRINICQGITLVRRIGWTLGFLKEDHACALSFVILGFVEEPDFAKSGHVVYPLYTETPEAGAKTQSSTPKMPVGEINSIILAPLHRADFEPDIVLIYGNAAQIARLVQGALYKEGGFIKSRFAGRCACGGEIVVPLTQQRCNIIIPGGGERIFALTADDELVFAVPNSKIESLIEGIVGTHKTGVARMPTPFFGARVKPEFPGSYSELEKYCGLRD